MSKKELVSVAIESVKTSIGANQTILNLKITNSHNTPIWLVNDEWFVWKRTVSNINLSFAREKMLPGVQVFGYFKPELIKVDPKNSFQKKVILTWPLTLNTIWNSKNEVNPSPGMYQLSITIGYGMHSKIENSNSERINRSVEQDVMDWQKYTTSRPVDLKITN